MVDRVFHQRLQDEFRQQTVLCLRVEVDLVAQLLVVAHLLDGQIAAHMGDLLFERVGIRAVTDG